MCISRPTRLVLLALLGTVLAAASITPAASAAAQRHASPTGTGTDCSAANPCSIKEAVEAANQGDEVSVAPGDYVLTTGLDAVGITVHGVPGEPRPLLLFDNAPTPSMQVVTSTLRYVEVVRAPGDQGIALYAHNASLDQVIVRGTAQSGWQTVTIDGSSTIRNSIVVAPGSNGTAILTAANGATATAAGTFRNVTAIATESGGVAIRARATSKAYVNVLARNVIARSGPASPSLRAETDNTGTAKITVGHSNWLGGDTWLANASIVDGGGNQSAAPAFVSAAGGDYRQAAGSPTIDAGLSEFINGPVDVDGDPRQIGTIDIGADEFVVAPAATTGPATAVTDQSATLSGSVNANGAATSYHFQYGPTTAYGSSTPTADAGSGGAIAAAATVGNMSPETTYHYRVVATNAGGVTKGVDQTFTTVAPATTSSTATTAAPTPAFAGVRLVSTRLSFARPFVTLKLSCPTETVGRCSGRTKLTARHRRADSRIATRVVLGRATFSIAAGKQAKVKARVSRAGRRLLSGVRRLRAKDINGARDGAGQSKTTMAAVTIRRRHR